MLNLHWERSKLKLPPPGQPGLSSSGKPVSVKSPQATKTNLPATAMRGANVVPELLLIGIEGPKVPPPSVLRLNQMWPSLVCVHAT
jgi:hypothetical protein